MDKRTPLPMTPFDTLTSSGELQMLKLLLPYTPPATQRMLAFFIRVHRASEYDPLLRHFLPGSGAEGVPEPASLLHGDAGGAEALYGGK